MGLIHLLLGQEFIWLQKVCDVGMTRMDTTIQEEHMMNLFLYTFSIF
jgi:hypothetical protein